VSSVSDRFGWLLFVVLVATGFAMWSPSGTAGQIVALVLQAGVLLLALRVSSAPRRLVTLGQVAVAAIVVGSLGLGATDAVQRRAVLAALAALLVVAAIAAIVGRLVGLQVVDRRTVLGAVCCYLLVGTLFAYVGVVAALDTDPFFADGEQATLASLQYFSFTTLTTLGYGDLAPVTRLGRSLAIVEALIGQIYLVTVVALLVGNLTLPAARRRTDAPGADDGDPSEAPGPGD
jgi:hypothetical protein